MIAPEQSPPIARPSFLAAVKASGLIAPADLGRLVADLPADARTGLDVARRWVAGGILTPFQADRLLDGRTDGFVLGQYVILEQVGRSPVGRSYKARHRTMNRLVAVEVLTSELTRDPRRRAAFQAEARVAARLAHPNIVTVLDCNQSGDRVWRILEYVDGADLDQLVTRSGPLPVARACEFARQTALGLAHAHEKGIAHGCLTPATVLVGRPGGSGRTDRPAVKVADFGLGRVVAPVGADRAAGPDPADFRAPELIHSPETPTPAADLYSLGCVLFFLLTGRRPFPGSTADEKIARHPSAVPPPIEGTRPDVPAAVAGLVRALMAREPTERPNAATVAGMLEPFGESADVGRVDFSLQPPGSGTGSAPYLTGLTVPSSGAVAVPTARVAEVDLTETSPWAGLDNPTLDGTQQHTPVTVKVHRVEANGVSVPTLAAVIGAALLLVGVAVGVILRAAIG